MSVLLLLVAGAGAAVGLCVGVVYHDSIVETFRRLRRRRVVMALPSGGNPYRDPTAVGVVVAQAVAHAVQQPPGKYHYWNARTQDPIPVHPEAIGTIRGGQDRVAADRPLGRYHDIVGADVALGPLVPTPKWVCPVCDDKAELETVSLGDSINHRPTAICTPDNHRPDCAEQFPKFPKRLGEAMDDSRPEGRGDLADYKLDLAWMQQAVVAALLHNQRPHLHLHCSSCGHRWTVGVDAADLALRR